MAKHICVSKYFADDKDLEDILSLGKFTEKRIREYAASRGIFLSPKDSVEDIISYLKVIPCSWPKLVDLIRLLDTRHRSVDMIPEKIETDKTFSEDLLEENLNAIKELSSKSGTQEVDIVKQADGKRIVTLKYYETDFGKTRLLQKEPVETVIEIDPKDNILDIRYQESSRSESFINELRQRIHPDDTTGEKSIKINLGFIREPKKRTEFFINLMTELYAHTFVDLTDLKVEYLELDEADELSETEEAKSSKKRPSKEEIKTKVKSVVFSGEGLLRSQQYQDLVNSNYFLCKTTWVAEQESSGGFRVKLSAELANPQDGSGFSYRIHGKYSRDGEGNIKKSIQPLTPLEISKMNTSIEQSAFDAYKSIVDEEKESVR